MNEQKWDLSRLDNGDLSALRRAAGTTGSDMAALRAFYRACGYCDPRLEAFWFPAVCMDAMWRSTDSPEVKRMEECLRLLLAQNPDTTGSLKHRIDMLLETPWTQDGFLLGKLYNLTRILKSRTNLKPDFQALADDLRRWNYPEQSVQRRWLRAIYNEMPKDRTEEENDHAD